MSHIDVYLTTSRWAQPINPESIQLIQMDIPVCTAAITMLSFGGNPSGDEEIEHRWAETCKEMAKHIIVDDIKKSIYIGDSEKAVEGTGLVEYQCEGPTEYNIHFFERWNVLKTLMFEFSVYGNDRQISFCLKGLWLKDHWHMLEVRGTSNVEVVSPKK